MGGWQGCWQSCCRVVLDWWGVCWHGGLQYVTFCSPEGYVLPPERARFAGQKVWFWRAMCAG